MAFLKIKDVSIKGVSACVPKFKEQNISLKLFESEQNAKKFIETTGVQERRIASETVTTSDLCLNAAESLIKELGWDKETIDCLIFVTQTPDFILPATSCILQNRLQLSKDCFTLDVSLGCSGWVHGLSVISSLMDKGSFKRGLLLAGDTLSKMTSPKDKSSYPLFGDAGTATALEYNLNAEDPIYFHFASDGNGHEAIIIKDGGYRNPFREKSLEDHTFEGDIVRNRLQLTLEGMDVFTFGISKAPQSVNLVTSHFELCKEDIDYYIFHQANLFMNEMIRKKLKLPAQKVPYSLKKYGNTSSATIPLTIVTELGNKPLKEKHSFATCGFGVGLSWGTAIFHLDNCICPPLVEI